MGKRIEYIAFMVGMGMYLVGAFAISRDAGIAASGTLLMAAAYLWDK